MSTLLCVCGACHAQTETCRQAPAMPAASGCGCSHNHAEAEHGDTDEGDPEGRHEHNTCCEHAQLDLSSIDKASDTIAVYRIINMDCAAEELLIRQKLEGMPGIESLKFNLMQRVLTVNHSLSSTVPIETALNAIGMKPESINQLTGNNADFAESVIPWRKLALAGVFALAAELAELIPDLGWFGYSAEKAWSIGSVAIMNWLPLGLAVIAIVLSGLSTYKKGWIAVKNFNLNINALMSVAVTGALFIGQYPEAAMVMVLFNLAEAIEARSLDKARSAIKNLLALAPEKATLQLSDGVWQETDIRDIVIGGRVRVKPGEKVALDGIIVKDHSTINQAPITGESMPVEKKAGDSVFAGTINESGSFEFEVTALASNSTLARIIHAVEEAQASRAPIQRFVDQFSRIYSPAVFLTALLVAVIPPLFLSWEWHESIYMGLVLLVIGCPCALVISTPVSIVSGMAAATRHGILVKGGVFLEQGRLLKWLALDKTGTITHGRPQQTDVMELGDLSREEVVTLAASLAARSDHPVSRAIAEAAYGVQLNNVNEFSAQAGQGVSGIISGRKWFLGNHRMVEDLNRCSPSLEDKVFTLEAEGKSVVMLVGDNRVHGLFAVADTLKESSVEAIAALKRMGIKTVMLTGDNRHTASSIAQQAGVDSFKAELLPQDKLAVVEELAKSGKVGMVGDGINDAPALAKADIGFAMAAAGTDTAIETADVALMDDDLRKIPQFIKLSKSTYAILMQNIAFAIGIKTVFFALTFMGLATMWMAVFADVGASLLVVANGLRAMRK